MAKDPRTTPELNDIAALVRAIELGSFAKVARELGVPTSTVARAVSRLEETLKTRLVQRSTRSFTPTTEGRELYEEAAPAVSLLHRAARSVAGAGTSPRGVLRVSATSEVGTWLLPPAVVKLQTLHPMVRVELELSNRNVNLVEEGFDVMLRLGPLNDSGLISTKLADLQAQIYASAAYIDKNGAPETLEQLARHPCILWRTRNGTAEWTMNGPDGPVKQVVSGGIASDDYGAVRAIVLEGAGIARLPRIMVAAEVRDGRLVRVLSQYEAARRAVYYLHESTRNVPSKVSVFRQLLIDDMARRELEWRLLDRMPPRRRPRASS